VEDKIESAIYEDEDLDADDINSDEDDDEDYDCNEELNENNLYDSKLDSVDEVLYFRDALVTMQQSNTQMYEYLIGCLDANEQNTLAVAIKRAEDYLAIEQ
jgi:hypothetical protein